MRPIPIPLRRKLEQLDRMKRCSVAHLQDEFGLCDGRIEWEHVWIYAGKQINERWAIIGVCHKHHLMKDEEPDVKDTFQRISLTLAMPADLEVYPRKDWDQIKKSLGI